MSRCVYCCALVAACGLSWSSREAPAQEVTPPPAATSELAQLEAKIESALGETTSLQFVEQRLGDVAAFLEDRHKIELQLDRSSLDTAGVTTDTPVTIDVEGISLRSALDLMLKSIELTYCVRDGVLLITTTEETENKLVTRVYDARRFLYVTDKYGERKRDSEPLFDLVMDHVEPTQWTQVGGTGSIDLLDQSAVVSQSWSTQQKVGDFMAALETALEQYKQGAFNAPMDVGAPASGSMQTIRQALNETTSLQFLEQPLADIVAFLEDRHKIEIQLDTNALDTAGVTNDTPATIDVEGLPLGNALNLMLKEIELTYTIRDEVLLITTTEEVEDKLTTRIYPVADLIAAEANAARTASRERLDSRVGVALMNTTPETPTEETAETPEKQPATPETETGAGGGGFYAEQFRSYGRAVDPILQAVTSAIAPTNWTDVGGTGSISYVPQFEGLVISQTQATHAKIEALLANLRQMREAQAASPADATDDGNGTISLRAYQLTRGNAPVQQLEKLVSLVQRNVEPDAWRSSPDQHFAETIDGTLMIQTTNANHRRIGELLTELGYVNQAVPLGGAGSNESKGE